MKKILAISGSTRRSSSNEVVLNYIKTHLAATVDFEIFDGIDKLPHFNPDLDNDGLPAIVQTFRDKIQAADGIIICSPEYVFSLPGSLKNAIEWNVSTTLFSNKPVALIVASASGQKAFEALDLIMTTLDADLQPSTKLIIPGIKGKINKAREIEDVETRENILHVVQSLLQSI
ncbi:NAD(P)H-dependent oxidoreductase [Reichenbachiella carrageenanivorans]|uniref:NAD(P)H-dependent oxidoreductase n=1 Tax=Reichenbachiella carrageenanivorans TaxID=2979869 RepID=A0ABY6D3I2_9BACT|nr:NADPH-dependent FMN reductase [Reichenbachiella carrageenanivorans]UXX80721.1 NAD(P)H-dependent oxidoreductase [Reichenbachiella carrageenanivorans]